MRAFRCFGLLLALTAAGAEFPESLVGRKTAVRVFARNEAAARFEGAARTRVEAVLGDNGIEVLDEEKAGELSDVFKTLEDPAAFVSAETFIENSRKFDLEGLIGVYVTVETGETPSGAFFATAHVDLRFVDNSSAGVRAEGSEALGVPGAPASEGLTATSASINAVRRAVEDAVGRLGLDVGERTRAGTVEMGLAPAEPLEAGLDVAGTGENDRELWGLAALEAQTWRSETVSCTARSPDGGVAAVAGYIRDTDFRRRPQRLHGSRVHVVDTRGGGKVKPIVVLEASPVAVSARDEPRGKEIVGMVFVGGWRYLAAVNGNHLFLWDTEQGRLLAKEALEAEPTALSALREKNGTYSLVVSRKGGAIRHRIVHLRP